MRVKGITIVVLRGAICSRAARRWRVSPPARVPSPVSRQSGRRIRLPSGNSVRASSNLNAIAEKCKADLGITPEMTATDSDAAAQRAVTQPNSYDVADIEYWIARRCFRRA